MSDEQTPHAFASTTVEVQDEQHWLQARALRIGASDAPIVCGVSKFESAFSLYHKKRATLEMTDDPEGFREQMYWGRSLEPAILGRFNEVTKRNVITLPKVTTHLWKPNPRLVASLDGLTRDDAGAIVPLEVKNVSAFFSDEWAEEAPIYYQVQCQHQMMVTGTRVAFIAALIGGNQFRWGKVERDDSFIELMLEREMEFLNRLDLASPPPVDGSDSTNAILKKLYPKDTGQIIELPPEAIDWDAALKVAKLAKSEAEAAEQLAGNQLRDALKDASVGVMPNGVQYSLKWQKRVDPPHAEPKISEFRVLRRHDKLGKK